MWVRQGKEANTVHPPYRLWPQFLSLLVYKATFKMTAAKIPSLVIAW